MLKVLSILCIFSLKTVYSAPAERNSGRSVNRTFSEPNEAINPEQPNVVSSRGNGSTKSAKSVKQNSYSTRGPGTLQMSRPSYQINSINCMPQKIGSFLFRSKSSTEKNTVTKNSKGRLQRSNSLPNAKDSVEKQQSDRRPKMTAILRKPKQLLRGFFNELPSIAEEGKEQKKSSKETSKVKQQKKAQKQTKPTTDKQQGQQQQHKERQQQKVRQLLQQLEKERQQLQQQQQQEKERQQLQQQQQEKERQQQLQQQQQEKERQQQQQDKERQQLQQQQDKERQQQQQQKKERQQQQQQSLKQPIINMQQKSSKNLLSQRKELSEVFERAHVKEGMDEDFHGEVSFRDLAELSAITLPKVQNEGLSEKPAEPFLFLSSSESSPPETPGGWWKIESKEPKVQRKIVPVE